MGKQLNLASALVEQISDLGLANSVDDFTLASLDGSAIAELSLDGQTLYVIEDGVEILSISIYDEEFNEVLMNQLSSSLNF